MQKWQALKKLNSKSASTPPPLFLRRAAPAPYFHPLFYFLGVPHSGGGSKNLPLSLFKKGGGGGGGSELCTLQVTNSTQSQRIK